MSRVEDIVILKKYIERIHILKNLINKNNNKITQKFITEKKDLAENIKAKFLEKLEISVLFEKTHNQIKSSFLKIFFEIIDLLNAKLNKDTKMDFEMDKTLKIIPLFDGETSKLSNFLNLTKYLYEATKTDDQEKLIQFIYNTRLTDKPKNRLIGISAPKTLVEFTKAFNDAYLYTRSQAIIQTELISSVQTNKPLHKYAERIERLIAELNNVQITEQGEQARATITSLNDKYAMNIFKNGLNENLASVIHAAQPESLSSAIKIATEVDQSRNSTNKIMFINRNTNYNSNRNNFNRINYNGNLNRNNFNRNNNHFNRNNNFNRNNYNNSNRINNFNRNNYNNNNFKRNNNNNNRHNNTNNSNRNNFNRNRNQNRNNRHINHITTEQGNDENLEV